VIVLGEYASYVGLDPCKKVQSEGLETTLRAVGDSFGHSLTVYETHYPEILKARREPKKGRYVKEFVLALGEEVRDTDLEKYYA
jgi:hypothetical protein